jgi:YHYH protein
MKSVRRPRRGVAICTVALLLATAAACSSGGDSKGSSSSATTTSAAALSSGRVTDLKLDPDKDYGNKYANGILPVGDNKYVTNAATKGSVYLCRAPQDQAGGAGTRGPWFVNDNTEYDINKKLAVEGDVRWEGNYSETISGGSRMITTNDLPRDHTTGVFPVQPSDPTYQYDRNPNQIAPQSLTYTLSAEPKVESSPSCLGGEVGVMLTGVALFNAFDAGGRDAGAWEVQDGCNGHPQISSEYHYHTLSSCIQDTSVNTVIGFALDGFPITGPKVGDDNILTTGDLDECHGITSTITLDDKQVATYHYVMTQDFPYSASCFRATATQPPGQPAGPPAGPPAPPAPPG